MAKTDEVKVMSFEKPQGIGRSVLIDDFELRRQAEEDVLRASEKKYSTLVEQSSDGVLILIDRQIEFANHKISELSGYSQDEMLGKDFPALIAPEYRALLEEGYYSRQDGKQVSDEYELELLVKDGRKIPVETKAQSIVYKNKSSCIVTVRDITNRKRVEDALKLSEQNFRYSIDSSSMGIRIVNLQGDTLYANQTLLDIFDYDDFNELKSSPPQDRFTPEAYAGFVNRKEKKLRNEPIPDKVEVDIKRKDGSIRHLQVFPKDIIWNGEKGLQIYYNDVTERKQAEESLRLSEQNFRNSMDSSFVGIRISDKNDVTSYVNQAFLDIFGYENIAEVISSPPPEHYTPEAHASWVLRHKQLLRGEPMPKQVDIDILRKDGTVRHLDVSMRQVFWDGKQQYQTLYNDITERKLTEEALKASEQNFRNSIDSSLMGFRIVDSDWRTLYVNQVFLDIYGYKNIDDMGIVNPEELYTPREYARYVERQEQRKQGILVKEDYVEQEIIRRDGAIRYVQTTKSEVFWNGQKQYQILCNDITERKQVEEKLEQAAREWRTTFDSITDLIYIHDKDNRIIRVNKAVADMLHTTPKELIGKFCYEVMHGTQEPPVNCPHLQTIKTSKPVSIETFNPGLGLHFHESTSPLFNENGEIAGSVLVVRDVTQQKRIEEQLILSDRLASIGELSSGIAHELNNPLTSVIGFSQLLMEGDVPAYMKQDLETIHNEAERAAVIVKNLLTFGRKHAPVKQLSYINTVIEDVLKLRAYEEKVNNIKIEKHFEQNLPQIMMDHFQMQQVFLNIIVNAEFAMLEAHHKGMLTITTEKESDFIRISIGDDGLGISEENLKHIFDPFFTTKEVGKGTGLGLSICHGIVNEHGGKIYANSKKNQGTTFVVELPF